MPPVNSRPLTRLYWTLVVSAVLAGLMAAATIATGIARQSEDEWVRHTLAVRNQISRVLSLRTASRDRSAWVSANGARRLPSAL